MFNPLRGCYYKVLQNTHGIDFKSTPWVIIIEARWASMFIFCFQSKRLIIKPHWIKNIFYSWLALLKFHNGTI